MSCSNQASCYRRVCVCMWTGHMPLLCWATGGHVFARFCPRNQPYAMVRCCALCPTAGLYNGRRRCLFSPRNILPEGAVACAWKRTRLGDKLLRLARPALQSWRVRPFDSFGVRGSGTRRDCCYLNGDRLTGASMTVCSCNDDCRSGEGRSKDVHNGWVSGAVVVVVNQVEKRSLALSMCNMGCCYWYYC
jgi:hypothetical protein